MVRPMLVLPYCSYVLCIIMTDNMVLPVKVIALLRCKYSTSHIKNRQRLLFSSQKLGSQDDLWFESKYMSPHYRLTNNNGWFDNLPPRWIWTQRDDKWAQKENDSKTRSTGSADTLQVNKLWILLNRIEKRKKYTESRLALWSLFLRLLQWSKRDSQLAFTASKLPGLWLHSGTFSIISFSASLFRTSLDWLRTKLPPFKNTAASHIASRCILSSWTNSYFERWNTFLDSDHTLQCVYLQCLRVGSSKLVLQNISTA